MKISPIAIILLVTILLLLVILLLTGCPADDLAYNGPYVYLNTVVMNSILGIYGVDHNNIVIVDEDSVGRQLFIYWGNTDAASYQLGADKPPAIFSILIAQKTEGDKVYYYPDYNFILYKDNREAIYWPNNEELLSFAHDTSIADDIEWLKQKNDWGNPLDESKCVSATVSRKNRAQESRTPLLTDEAAQKAYDHVNALPDYFSRTFFAYLASDKNDRHIYFFRVLNEDKVYIKSYVVMFNKDGSFDSDHGIMEITDLWHYQDELKAFKDSNGWLNTQ